MSKGLSQEIRMYSCYVHNWSSHFQSCPSCQTTYTTSSATVTDDFIAVSRKDYEALRADLAVAVEALERLYHWADVASHKMLDSDNWPATLALKCAQEALAKLRSRGEL